MSRCLPSLLRVGLAALATVALFAVSAMPAAATDDPATAPAATIPASSGEEDEPGMDEAAFDAEFDALDAEFKRPCDFKAEECWENGVRQQAPGTAARRSRAKKSHPATKRRTRARKHTTAARDGARKATRLRSATRVRARSAARVRRTSPAPARIAHLTSGVQVVPRGGVEAGTGGPAPAATDGSARVPLLAGALALLAVVLGAAGARMYRRGE